ncbi:hypothetical protein LINPERHAP2_LOCUS27886, partial [Linum perenne]
SQDEIIDCVDIYKQPSFNHPLLKNHTLQLKRNSYPNELETKETTNLSEHTQMWHRKGEYCPEGTVAILRSSMTDLPPKRPSNRGTSKYTNSDAPKVAGGEYAAAFLPGEDYHGANAVINVWNPKVESEEFSAAQMWVTDGGGTKIESIEAGWIVTSFNPHPSFFTYWTNDGYETSGCYNMQCSGFILASTKIALGARIDPVSTYGGDQRSVRVKINQDLKTGNWWLNFQGVDVGYWPSVLFRNLRTSASLLEWGGEIINREAKQFHLHTDTQMGNGHFPSGGYRKAAYFRSLEFVDGGGFPNSAFGIMGHATRPECYDIDVKDPTVRRGVHFYFGGPGFSLECN